MTGTKLAKIAFILIALSLLFPWYTVSTSTNAEDYQYYYKSDMKEHYGPSEITLTTKLEFETKNDKDYEMSKFIIPINSNLLDSTGDILESPMIVSFMLLKEKLLISILLISSAILNATYGRNIEITKRLFELSTIIMLIVVIGFLVNIKGNYVATNGDVLAYTDDEGEDEIIMIFPFGYSSITDTDGRMVNTEDGTYVDEEISVRWHPSVGFLLAIIGTILLVNTVLFEYKKNYNENEVAQEYSSEELQEVNSEPVSEAAIPIEEK
ncbi:MAG: hypothetical protein ACJZ33_00575 [Candidatus Poseidoniales archaeon]